MTNVVYLIGDKQTGEIFNCETDSFSNKVGLTSFFPSHKMAVEFRNEKLGDGRGRYFDTVETNVIKFVDGELVIAYEPFAG